MALRGLSGGRATPRLRPWCGLGALVVSGVLVWAIPATAAEPKPEPSVLHGMGKLVGGILFELPKTVLEATLEGPPVVGTMVGLLAGTARGLQTSVSGLFEMAAGFDPWGSKRKR